MPMQLISYKDAAAISYIETCLKYRASRLRKKWTSQADREHLILNSLAHHDNQAEKIDLISDPSGPLDKNVVNRLLVEQAMTCLTEKEKMIIRRLFHSDTKVRMLCDELHISKNAVLKTKRNALEKMKARIR